MLCLLWWNGETETIWMWRMEGREEKAGGDVFPFTFACLPRDKDRVGSKWHVLRWREPNNNVLSIWSQIINKLLVPLFVSYSSCLYFLNKLLSLQSVRRNLICCHSFSQPSIINATQFPSWSKWKHFPRWSLCLLDYIFLGIYKIEYVVGKLT